MVFDAGHPALRAQQDLLEAIEEGVGAFGVYLHDRQPALAVLADMKGIARRVLFHMSADHMTRLVPAELVQAHLHARRHNSSLSSRLRRAPVDPARVAPAYAATAAVGATAAWSILGQADCRQAAPRMRELLDAIVDRGYWTSPTVTRAWGSYTSPLLESVHLTTVAPNLRPSATLRYRTALPVPSSPTTTALQVTARARKIPGLIWPFWSVRLNPVPRVREHLASALAAGLLLVDSRIELPAAVKKLGDLIDQPILTNVLQALRDDAHYEGIQLALIHLAAFLDSHEVPIDYARRRHLDYTDLLPENEWIDLCHRTLMDPGAGARHKAARCYLFEKISGLPHTRIPIPPRDTYFFRSSVAHFPRVLIQAAAAELDRAGREFLDRNHLAHEPLTWQPPPELLHGLDLPRADPAGIDIDALHRLVLAGQTSARIASELGTDVPTLRYVLCEHPLELPEPTLHEPHTGGRGRTRLHVARRTVSQGQLERLYVQQEKSFVAIARETGVDRKTLAALADVYGIARSTHRPRGSLDRE